MGLLRVLELLVKNSLFIWNLKKTVLMNLVAGQE